MIRCVHCPNCDSLNEVEGLTKTIEKITRAVDQGGKKYSCRDCGWKFSVIQTGENRANFPLFTLEAIFYVDPFKEDIVTSIPLEHEQDIEFEYDLIVREGSEIEILFLKQSEMEPLRQGQRFRVFTEHCRQGVLQAESSGVLPAGRNRMVLRENENNNDRIQVECNISAYPI